MSFPSTLRILDLANNQLSGSIPSTFLNELSSSAVLDIDLSGNLFDGAIPGELARFNEVDLFVQNNRITSIDSAICSKAHWNDGDVGKYGCHGLLCQIGFFSKDGRQSSDGSCKPCSSAPFFGTTVCEAHDSGSFAAYLYVVTIVIPIMLIIFTGSCGIMLRKKRERIPLEATEDMSSNSMHELILA